MLELWHLWLIGGIVFWIVEIFTPGFVAGVFGTSCLIIAPLAAFGASLTLQLLLFGIATAGMGLALRPLVIKHLYKSSTKEPTNVDALIGKIGLVTETLDLKVGTGQVRLGGELWKARTSDESRVEAGTKVRVCAIEGCTVIVETASTEERREV